MEKKIIEMIQKELQTPNIPSYKRNRMSAVGKYLAGQSSFSIATDLNLSPRSVQRYIRAYQEKGISSLFNPQRPGNKHKLNDEQMNDIKRILQKEPTISGYLFPKWTARLLRRYIKKTYGTSLSQELCRQLLMTNQDKEEKQSPFKERKAFEQLLAIYLRDSDTEVWILSDIYLGIRERRKNKQGKLPYYPEDLLKDPASIPNVDLTQKAKEEWVLCLESMKSKDFFFWHHSDQQEELSRYKEVIQTMVRHTEAQKVVIIMPETAIHRRNFLKIYIKQSKKSFKVEYFPFQSPDLNPLNNRKEHIIETFQLKKKETQERKILSEQKVKQILNYLQQISHHKK
ncbi:helix-turn-helix domain-containing protein [Falsibacillus pallidus]|uniref:helix-turn-helix domain-containing protein n=1 Tax=Falsibacillus pallidus TaxID=493781 RepID=UPI003D99B07F